MRDIIVDGSEGEGGGQVLRTSLSLSAITGRPVRIENVRGRRKKPGLKRQHLTALNAAAEICGAKVEGAELNSPEISFHPSAIKGGAYNFEIGSAGAANLVAQTILPILSHAREASTAVITGGTHNLWAPTFDFFNDAFLPLFRKMGGRADAELNTYGFNPAGGGSMTLSVKPIEDVKPLELLSRGERISERVTAVVANLKGDIAAREIKTILHGLNLAPEQGQIIHTDGPGPGNVASLFLEYENVTQVFTGIGQHGVRAETLAKTIVADAQKYLQANSADGQHRTAVCEHLADQLLLPMALMKGGALTAMEITQHTRTNIDIIRRFLDVNITLRQNGRKCWTIEVAASA